MYFIVKTVIISLCIIACLHYLWIFIKENYSTKKTVDVIGFQTNKYKTILEELLQNTNINSPSKSNIFMDESEYQSLDNELESFIREEISL
jgi:hypothetical protein